MCFGVPSSLVCPARM
ncbi:hypothetical protein PENSOL_c043G05277 [Penicillium solitum]|uniref:Uncharacterized protein n=1 Tax=Penicillium solitum TaxID=60172 RepID=A0A1V6QTF0_9EURO|nr:hypothetical protein PENSOL_c043G05277 [Penicillium solitum]